MHQYFLIKGIHLHVVTFRNEWHYMQCLIDYLKVTILIFQINKLFIYYFYAYIHIKENIYIWDLLNSDKISFSAHQSLIC